MRLKNDLFPYPVLNSDLDDFSSGEFNGNITTELLSLTRIGINVDFSLKNKELQQLIDTNKARFAVHLEGESSAYRKFVFLENRETFKTIELETKDAPKKLYVNMMIVATESIENYQNSGFNTDYYGKNFIIPMIEKGSILAYIQTVELMIEFSNFEQKDLGSIIRVASKKQREMDVEITGDIIQINLPEKTYSAYVNLSNSSSVKQRLLLATIILPALTIVIETIGREPGEYKDLRWYEALGDSLKKIDYDIDELYVEDGDALHISQRLLDFPLETVLYDFYESEEGDNN